MADRPDPTLDDFLGEPTRDLDNWRWLWKGDREFPIRSHRGVFGRLLVRIKRLFRPLVKVPQNDLWERQRVFNLILLEYLRKQEELDAEREKRTHDRLVYLEGLAFEGVTDLMHHNDAVFARVDQKLDRYRREVHDLLGGLGAALARVEQEAATIPSHPAETVEKIARSREEHAYFELERRYRGTQEEIAERIAVYLPYLEGAADIGRVLDLGCGRGESLALLAAHGIPAEGVDASAQMVALCRERGLAAEEGDLLDKLAAVPAGSLGGVVSFHVIEHLPPEAVDRLVRLAFRALASGGVLILETPNPLSLVVAARNFWLDPTHRRPVHPESLRLAYELAGFEPIERIDLRPFPADQRLPEIDLAQVPAEERSLADQVNRLRDRIDELLFGFQDFGMVGTKPG
ncbi:MAG TPA: class I SAM-dependent methyltransferase [Thermoanaerobaculia bacterium]|nr:class I SAM-dependent methyltransferase [Thermoanaerobaculia bacterium]